MSAANAKTIRIGNQGDALSLDPHSLNESLQLSVTGNVSKRSAFIAEAFKLHSDDIGHLPLHQQALAWGVSKKS